MSNDEDDDFDRDYLKAGRHGPRVGLADHWSIHSHHGVAAFGDGQGVHYAKHLNRQHGEATATEYNARKSEIPEDTRDLTATIFGDPLPARSALSKLEKK
jgi:hypothetical protein